MTSSPLSMYACLFDSYQSMCTETAPYFCVWFAWLHVCGIERLNVLVWKRQNSLIIISNVENLENMKKNVNYVLFFEIMKIHIFLLSKMRQKKFIFTINLAIKEKTNKLFENFAGDLVSTQWAWNNSFDIKFVNLFN